MISNLNRKSYVKEYLNIGRKTILVTGATGLIGKTLVERLALCSDLKIIVLGRDAQKIKFAFAKFLENKNFSYIIADVNKPLPAEIPHVDAIFHAAALINRDAIVKTPVEVIQSSLFALKGLLDLMLSQKREEGNCRLVVFSSMTVYGNNTCNDIVVTEADTSVANSLDAVNSPYSESKRMAEVLARAYTMQYALDVVIARPSWVYGNAPFPNLGTAVSEFVKKAIEGEDIILNTSGFPRRDNIYVDDVVTGLLTLLNKGEIGNAYNISSSGELNNFAAVDEIAEIIAKITRDKFKLKTKVIYSVGRLEKKAPGVVCDNKKLKALGWTPNVSLEEGLFRTISEKC
jgi:nucleoside-diphosphate-sugar epimerase